MFPKSWNILSPGTFASILFGIGLIGGGLLLRSGPFRVRLLCTLLLWSILLNFDLFNVLYNVKSGLKVLDSTVKALEQKLSTAPASAPQPPSAN
jgi:hypothetical protein